MAAQNKISHQVGEFQNDVFRFDIHGVKSDIVGSHPLETLCQSVKFSSFLLFPFNSHYFPLNSIKYYSRISLAHYIYIYIHLKINDNLTYELKLGGEIGVSVLFIKLLKRFLLFVSFSWVFQAKQREEEMKRRILVNTYGTAFPMKMDFDRQILSRYGFWVI